jgi:hypothetical protein
LALQVTPQTPAAQAGLELAGVGQTLLQVPQLLVSEARFFSQPSLATPLQLP